LRLKEAFGAQVVHQIDGVVGCRLATGAVGLAKEKFLASHFRFGRELGVEFAVDAEVGRRWEVEDFLKFCHCMDLRRAVERVDAFLRRDHRVDVEVRCALLELGEVFDGFQRTLRTK